MSVISFFNASYCHGDEVAELVANRMGYELYADAGLVAAAADRFGNSWDKLERILREYAKRVLDNLL